jgi:uncharacterized protein YndB with AHSA1/START domain
MSLAAAAKHVHVLERAGLLQRTIDGRRHICRLEPGPLASAHAWLAFYERHWSERLDALEDLLRRTLVTDERLVVRLERTIAAPPERVYRAWLDPELLAQWMAPGPFTVTRAEVDERPGGRFRIWHACAGWQVGGFDCELAELVPGHRIVFRWGFVGPEGRDGPAFDSLLTVTFREAPGEATVLTLVHERLDDLAAARPDVAANVSTGWEDVVGKLSGTIAGAAFTPDATIADLTHPAAVELLERQSLARMAYAGPDGFPRVIPVGFLWKGGRIIVCTAPTSPKFRALSARPHVALTIDSDDGALKTLSVRGVAAIDVVDGIPDEYLEASTKTMSGEQASQFEANVRQVYKQMARIAIEPTWARYYDFSAGRVPEFLLRLVNESAGATGVLEPGGPSGHRDLPDVRGAREQDQLVAAGLAERLQRLDDLLRVGQRAVSDPRGVRAGECVVVAQVAPRVLLGVLAQTDVRQGGQPGLPGAARLIPDRPGLLRARGERFWPAAAHDPAVAELDHPAQRRVRVPAEQHRRPARPHRHRPDRPGEAARLLRPHRPHLGELGVEVASSRTERRPGRLEVVGAPADRDAELQPALGDPVHRGQLLGQQRAVAAVGADEDRGREPDPFGRRGRGRQHGHRLHVAVHDAVERSQGGEAGLFGGAGPPHDQPAGNSGDRGRKTDTDIHGPHLARPPNRLKSHNGPFRKIKIFIQNGPWLPTSTGPLLWSEFEHAGEWSSRLITRTGRTGNDA